MKKCIFLPVILFCWSLCLSAAPESSETLSADGVSEEQKQAFEQIARFTLAMEQIHRMHAAAGNEVDYETLIDGAIEGMMAKLDRYSSYLNQDSLQELEEQTRGVFGGVGIVINRGPRFITVVSPIEGTPGWEAGLAAGDQIIAIDGESARDKSMREVVDLLRGEPGTDVEVRFRRPSENRMFRKTLTRAVIENKSVPESSVLEDGIGYIRVKQFMEDTVPLLRKELTRLNKKGVQSVVLDLRGNPGGLLTAAVDTAGLFLPRESLVVSTRGKETEQKDYLTTTRPHRLDPRLVILVNRGSASAAEIVSGALQDYDRATLVGTKTFGKASVQSILPMPDGSALRLTTATYITPEEREIHEKGLEPDVTVPLPMRTWLRLRSQRARDWDWSEDPQLMKAVELLRAQRSEKDVEEPGG